MWNESLQVGSAAHFHFLYNKIIDFSCILHSDTKQDFANLKINNE